MNIQKEEEGYELDKSDRVRREKRGRGRQKIQTSRRLMSECASANGQQGKWDTITWLPCAVWTSSMFICLVRLLELDPLILSLLLVSRVQILAPPHTSCHPLGASLSLGLIDRFFRHSGCVYSFLILQPRKENVSLKSPSLKSPGALVLSPLKWTAKSKLLLCLQLYQEHINQNFVTSQRALLLLPGWRQFLLFETAPCLPFVCPLPSTWKVQKKENQRCIFGNRQQTKE